jgi:hypothetical protein
METQIVRTIAEKRKILDEVEGELDETEEKIREHARQHQDPFAQATTQMLLAECAVKRARVAGLRAKLKTMD